MSVCGTITILTRYEDFLGSMESIGLRDFRLSYSHLELKIPGFSKVSFYMLKPAIPSAGRPILLRPPFAGDANIAVREY